MSLPNYNQGRGRGAHRPSGFSSHLAHGRLAQNPHPPLPPPPPGTPYTVTTSVVNRAMREPQGPNAPLQPAPFDALATRVVELMKLELQRLETTVADKTNLLLEGQRQLSQDMKAVKEDVHQLQDQLNELAQRPHGPPTVNAFRVLVEEVKALRMSMQPESKSPLWQALSDLRYQVGDLWERCDDPMAIGLLPLLTPFQTVALITG